MDQSHRLAFPDDALPPEGIYKSRESLLAAINSWAKPRGYAFTTGKSLKTSSGRIKVIFACDRNKLPPSTSITRQRRTCSRRTGCKFSVLAKQSLDGNTWVLSHRPDKEYAHHNHPPSPDASAHPAHRQLNERDAAIISSLTTAGAAPRDIRTYLHNSSDTLATQQDIYNRIAATRRDLREGQSSIQALVDQLQGEGFWCRVRLDSDNRLTAIFFAHPDSVAYLQSNPDVLLLDCTYKTNKHAMPLLDMVGVDSCQRSFCIAFAFLSGESEEDYSWALHHLKSLYHHELPSVVLTDRCLAAINATATWFPSSKALLCLWHVNKAILQYCQPDFVLKSGDTSGRVEDEKWDEFYGFWHTIVDSPTEEIFRERLAKFELKYAKRYPRAVGYIKLYWLEPHKERIIKAWVDKYLHFGNVATSRAEGIHSLIKSYIKTSTFDLFDSWQAMRHAVTNQLKELNHIRASQQIRTPLDISGGMFEAVQGWVSHQALRKVQEQRKLALASPQAPCSQSFTSSHGLPCSHTLKRLEEEQRSLLLDHFHPHWNLKRGADRPRPILEPRRAPQQGIIRARGQPATSTKREPSGFEISQPGKKAPSTCSRCHAVGHARSSRACPLRFQDLLIREAPASKSIPQPDVTPVAVPSLADPIEAISVSQGPSLVEGMPVLECIAEATARSPATAHTPLAQSSHTVQVSLTAPQHSVVPDCPVGTVPGPSGEECLNHGPSDSRNLPSQPLLRYDSPEAIYGRYVAARSAWYAAQPAGSIKTNQQYRRAMGLPLRYDKQSYEWCLDYKQMSKRCITSTGSREWTKEEMMAYLDWSKAEDERIEAQVVKEMGKNPLANKRRGMAEIWRKAEIDSIEQETLYAAEDKAELCIVVKR
ncbi:PKS-NRPS hybrid synthetase [Fusarium oxysporum f. sp. conglutinans]|nr:PKS-NRPS hybrid synthetase [Fusarium oxysporum f. sp. conglutinans]